MKKTKACIILLIIILINIILFSKVNAHSVELDPESLIGFPFVITNGNGNISISKSETGYNLYFQSVEIPNETFTQIEETKNKGKTELSAIKTIMDELNSECDDLQEIYDRAYKEYKDKVDANVTGSDLESSKTAYETARTNYQNKLDEYNAKVREYNDTSKEMIAKINDLTPSYVEGNWTQINDGSFSIDLSKFNGERSFAIWAKLVRSDGTIYYDEETYTLSGTKGNDTNIASIRLDKTVLLLEKGESYILNATLNPEDLTDKPLVWTSDNEKIAKVENGKVTGIADGTANIEVKTEDGKYTATCKVTVGTKTSDSSNDDKVQDDTVINSKLPQTGTSAYIIVSVIIIITIMGIATFIKIKHLDF